MLSIPILKNLRYHVRSASHHDSRQSPTLHASVPDTRRNLKPICRLQLAASVSAVKWSFCVFSSGRHGGQVVLQQHKIQDDSVYDSPGEDSILSGTQPPVIQNTDVHIRPIPMLAT